VPSGAAGKDGKPLDWKFLPGEHFADSIVLRVRELSLEEGERLRRIVHHGQNAIAFKRAQIVLACYQAETSPGEPRRIYAPDGRTAGGAVAP
jgi:hypothetical protein